MAIKILPCAGKRHRCGQVGLGLFEVMFLPSLGISRGSQATILNKSEIVGKERGHVRDIWGAGASLWGLELSKAAVPVWSGEKGGVGHIKQRGTLLG